MMKTRVLMLDTSNRKLLWKKALERAVAEPEPLAPTLWQVIVAAIRKALA